jgi:hypothetical protein
MQKPPVINNMLRLKGKINLLDSLNELELAHTMSIRSLKKLEMMHPSDVYY